MQNNNTTPRYIIIIVILSWALYNIWPTIKYNNLTSDEKENLLNEGKLEKLESNIIRQGLDLKGGMYIVLEADIPTLIKNLATNRSDKFDKAFETALAKFNTDQNQSFFEIFREEILISKIKLARHYHEYGSNLEEIISSLQNESEDAINRVLEILQNRVDQFGVSEPTIQKQGNYRILVELAGVQNSNRARALLQSTALLEFYLVKNNAETSEILNQLDELIKNTVNKEELKELSSNISTTNNDNTSNLDNNDKDVATVDDIFGETIENINDSTENNTNLLSDSPIQALIDFVSGGMIVNNKNFYALKKLISKNSVQEKLRSVSGSFLFSNESEIIPGLGKEKYYKLFYLEDKPELTGGVVEKAKANLGSLGGGNAGLPVVSLDMNAEGSKAWSRITGSNIGERIAIVLDGKVHMAPNIREKIPGGRTQIEGFADLNEAKDIAIILRAGALPAPINIIEERTVGPSLGADSIEYGKKSIFIALTLVFIFMFIYYKLSGAIANFALIWNILIILAVLASLGATLTLPGIAGLILTVGMCIDSNVIIFERIREELNKGKTPKSAIESGYNRAITTIIDANLTTVIASLVLYQFGTGPIKGFATVLFWGIMISMFTAVYITRTIFYTITKKSLNKLSI